MPIDNPEISHTSYDIEKNQTPVVQEEITQSQRGIEDTISEINEGLDGLRLELPKTIEEQEKEVLELVKVRGLRESFENGTLNNNNCEVTKIQEKVFSFKGDNGNVMYFIDNNGEIIFGIVNIIERPFIENKKALKYAGYIEKKEDGVYNMYKIEGDKEVGPIDIDSPEYYQAWLDILFYADILNKLLRLKHNVESDNLDIRLFIKHGGFKFEDLELFLKKGLITQEIFNFGVKEMQKVIVAQCSDERLIKLKTPVRESDLMKYYSKGYIDKETAVECYKAMPSDMRDITNKKLKD